MNYKELFNDLKIETVGDCFKYLYNILFGWKDVHGNIKRGVNDASLYSLQSPDELAKSKVGICWDVTEFARAFFREMTNYKFDTFYIMYDDNAGSPSHTILVYYDKDSLYYFEPTAHHCSYPFSGIHEFENINDLLCFVVDAFLKNSIGNGSILPDYDIDRISVHRYEQPKFHINGYEMRNHIDNSEIVEVKYDRKFI